MRRNWIRSSSQICTEWLKKELETQTQLTSGSAVDKQQPTPISHKDWHRLSEEMVQTHHHI